MTEYEGTRAAPWAVSTKESSEEDIRNAINSLEEYKRVRPVVDVHEKQWERVKTDILGNLEEFYIMLKLYDAHDLIIRNRTDHSDCIRFPDIMRPIWEEKELALQTAEESKGKHN